MGDDIGIIPRHLSSRPSCCETANMPQLERRRALHGLLCSSKELTRWRNAFFTGIHPLQRHIPSANCPGRPSWLRPSPPAVAKVSCSTRYNTCEVVNKSLGDHAEGDPTAHGFQEFWGYLYHLELSRGKSSPPHKNPDREASAALPQHASTGASPVPFSWIRERQPGRGSHAPVLAVQIDPLLKRTLHARRGPLDLDRRDSGTRKYLGQGHIDYLDRNDPNYDNKPFFVWYNPARMSLTTVLPPSTRAMIGGQGCKDWPQRSGNKQWT